MRPEPAAASRPPPPAPPIETAAAPRPAPQPEPVTPPPAPEPPAVAQAEIPVGPEPVSEPEIPEPAPAEIAEVEPEQTAAVESADTTLAEAPAMDSEDGADPASAAEPLVAESAPVADTPSDGSSPMGLYAAGAGVCALLLGGLFYMRRRGSSDSDSDVDVSSLFAASDGDTDDRPIPKQGFSMGAPPASDVDEAPTVARTSAPVTAGRGMEDEALEEKEAMQDNDMTIGSMDSEAATQLGVGANVAGGAASGNIVRIIQDMESRIAHLEARLDESVEARKQLEQQVAAQTEELRVQRAAIARTQRALRSMSRGDEEQATEPALRNPDAAPRSE